MASLTDVVSDYDYLVSKYFEDNNLERPKKSTSCFKEDSATLYTIQQVIKSFYAYRLRVDNFEEEIGKNEQEYLRKSRERGSNPFLTQTHKLSPKEVKERKKAYHKKSKQQNYAEAISAIAFLKKIVDLLEKASSTEKKVKVSDALDLLARTSSGNTELDKENKRLLELYQETIKEDVSVINSERVKSTENNIVDFRKKYTFYHWKARSGNLFLPTDQKDLGFHSNCGYTFKELFKLLRNETKKVTFDTIPFKQEEHNFNKESYVDRISRISRDVERIESRDDELGKHSQYDDNLSKDDIDTLRATVLEAVSKVKIIRKLHKELMKSNNKKNDIMVKYAARVQRLAAIEETLRVTKDSQLPRTRKMLEEARKVCINEKNKYQTVVSEIERDVSRIENEIREFDNLMNTFDALASKSLNAKLEQQNAMAREFAESMSHHVPQGPSNQKEIDEVKKEVLHDMYLEGKQPFTSFDGDYEHVQEHYSDAFNAEFVRRLIAKLRERGIDYEGADLSNPYDTSIREEAHELSGGSRK